MKGEKERIGIRYLEKMLDDRSRISIPEHVHSSPDSISKRKKRLKTAIRWIITVASRQ